MILNSTTLQLYQFKAIVLILIAFLVVGCNSLPKINNESGRKTAYVDPRSPGLVSKVGIESQDIISMSDKIVRDLLNTPEISNREIPARILIDGKYFDNQSSSRINKNIIAARIRNNLNRFSKGRIIFVDRRHLADVKRERRMKREGEVERGSLRDRKLVAGVDYQMTAEIMSDDKATLDGERESYFYISFELLDMEYSNLVWTNHYEFSKSGQADAAYR